MCVSWGDLQVLEYMTRTMCCLLGLKYLFGTMLGMKMPRRIVYGARGSGGVGTMVIEVSDPKWGHEGEVYTGDGKDICQIYKRSLGTGMWVFGRWGQGLGRRRR